MEKELKPKILHILEAGRYSGPNSTILSICSGNNKFFKFKVIAGNDEETKFKELLEKENIDYNFLNLTRIRGNLTVLLRYFIRFPFEVIEIIKVIRKFNPDLIHTHTYLDFKGLIAGKLTGTKVVWQIHLDKCDPKFEIVFNFFKRIHQGHFICVSNITEKSFLPELKGTRSSIIQSSVDTTYFNKEIKTSQSGPIKIGSIGNYHYRKGFELVFEIAQLFEPHKKDYEFHILGGVYGDSKNYFNQLKRLKDSMGLTNLFLYTSEKTEVKSFLQDKSIFLMTSYAEASPFVAWESASMGLPIVSTDVGDVKNYVEKYESGYVLNNRDPQRFKIMIEKVNILEMSKNSRRMAEECFDKRIIAEEYMKTYKKLLSE